MLILYNLLAAFGVLLINKPGFYTLDPISSASRPSLILAPFHGAVACQTIASGRGVCGTAFQQSKTIVVPAVDEWPGHIACDSASKSEIVVPITDGQRVVGVIDVDCAVLEGFDEVDREGLEKLAALLGRSCDW